MRPAVGVSSPGARRPACSCPRPTSHDPHRLAPADRQIYPQQHRLPLSRVGIGHALQRERSAEANGVGRAVGGRRLRLERGQVVTEIVDPRPAVSQLGHVEHDPVGRGDDAEAGVRVEAQQRQDAGRLVTERDEQAHEQQPTHEDRLHRHAQRGAEREEAQAQSRRGRDALAELTEEEGLAPGELDLLHGAQTLLQRLKDCGVDELHGAAPARGGPPRQQQGHRQESADDHHRHQGDARRGHAEHHDEARHHQRLGSDSDERAEHTAEDAVHAGTRRISTAELRRSESRRGREIAAKSRCIGHRGVERTLLRPRHAGQQEVPRDRTRSPAA